MPYNNLLHNGLRWLANPYALLDEAQMREGPTLRMALPGMGRVLLTGDPQLIQAVLANRHLIGGKGISLLRTLFGGESLITLHGEAHTARRRLLSALFRPADLAHYDALTVSVTQATLRAQPCAEPFAIAELARHVTLRVILRFAFGALPPAQEAAAFRLCQTFTTSFANPLLLFLKPLRLNLGRHSPWGRAMHNRQQLQNFIRQQWRTFTPTTANAQSALAHLAQQSDLAESAAVDELFALLMFGHDSAAVTLAWACAHIYSHPATLARLRAHIPHPEPVEGLQASPLPEPVAGNGEAASPTEAESFLEACLNESMRLCPVVVQLFRVAEQPVSLGSSVSTHTLRRGEMMMPCTYLAHHNPAVFPDPERFLPERFMHGQTYSYAFFPFGFGNRLCLGKPLAQRQMLLILATLLQEPGLALAPGYQPTPERQMVLIAPRAGTLMVKQAHG